MSRSLRFLSIAAIACAAAAGAFMSAAIAFRDYVVSVVHRAWDLVAGSWRLDVGVHPELPSQERPRVALVMAKAFILRLMQRGRPRVPPLWRMCPSM